MENKPMKPTKSRMAVLKAKAEVDSLWFHMCFYDYGKAIDPTSEFCRFSAMNPFVLEYSDAMAKLQAALKADKQAQARNASRRARHQAMLDCGLVRVRVNGKVFYE
jgi:hypothetical protein